MQNRHFLKLLGLSRYTAVFVAFLVSAMTLATLLSLDVYAKGEAYSWEDKETISGTGGELTEGSNLFSKKQAVNVYPTPTIIEAYTYDDVVTTPDGCVVNLAIQVNSANKAQGTLRRVADISGGSNQCPDTYKISDHFNTQLKLNNADAAGSNPSTVVTVTIRSLVVEGEDFPADGDTLTLKNQGSDKVLATKKATSQHAYAADGYEGYERTFKFKTTSGQKFYEACSAALGQCATADLSILTGPLNIYVIDIKQVVTNVTCSAGALGWVLCPLSEALVSAIEGIAEILKGLLIYQPLLTSEQGKATRAIWQSLLTIANVGLVIAILVIVFSQATSVGLSSYGIKKLLPRVIAAAILMNLSFYICAAAVDLSNILGISIKTIVEAGLNQISGISAIDPDLQAGADSTDWIVTITGALLVAAIAAATGAIFLLIPVLIAGCMAIFTALLIIAARQVLITLLIIVAPLAILAWILPNTDEWFTKWRKLFTILLLMFPMIMAIFYGSILVSSVILTSSTNTGSGLNNFTITLLAFLVLVVPLFSLPFVMKSIGGVLERFGAITNNKNKGLVDRTKRLASNAQKNSRFSGAMAYRRDNRELTRAKRRARPSGLNKAMGAAGGSGYSAYTQRKATAIEDKEFEQGVSDAATGQRNTSFPNLKYTANDVNATEYERVAAARTVMQKGNFDDRKSLYDEVSKETTPARLRQSISDQFYARGDSSVLGSSYGGALLEGNSNGNAGALTAAAEHIKAGKITPQALVQDSGSTELLLKVAAEPLKYGITAEHIAGLKKAADEALINESTKTKAAAPVFAAPIEALSGLSLPPTPPPSPGAGPSGPAPSPPSSPPSSPASSPGASPASDQTTPMPQNGGTSLGEMIRNKREQRVQESAEKTRKFREEINWGKVEQ